RLLPGMLGERPRRRRARIRRGGSHGVVRLGVRRRIGPDRALSSHRGHGTPARLIDRMTLATLVVSTALLQAPTLPLTASPTRPLGTLREQAAVEQQWPRSRSRPRAPR